MTNQKNIEFKILQTIFKNVKNKKRKCLLCDSDSINSHLLQRNGILNEISRANHVIQIQANDFFVAEKKGLIDTKLIGVKDAMSYDLFCNKHDTSIFKEIESSLIDFSDYKSQLLFSYRSLCAELIKKVINIDIFTRILKSSNLSTNANLTESIKLQLEGNEQGVREINYYKNDFEKDITNSSKNFYFETIKLDTYIPICASAAYSPINPTVHNLQFLKDEGKRLNYIFLNIIPYKNDLILIIGYHKQQTDEWISSYIDYWKNTDDNPLSEKLTDLISTKIETWAISPEYFDRIDKTSLKKFKEYWNENAMNLTIQQNIKYNLFKNCS